MPFTNLDGSRNDRGPLDILKWKLDRATTRRLRATGPDDPAPRVDNDGALLRGADRSGLTWIGHATFLVQVGGLSILLDPILSDRIFAIRRFVPPGLCYAALPRVDAVLVTHNHYDHMDAPTLRALGPEPTFVVPRGLGRWFAAAGKPRVVELDWWGTHALGEARITFVPSQHWSRRGLFDENASLWGGYVLEDGTHRVYHSGDTAYFGGFREIGARVGRIDAALLPIGAYEPRWFMRTQHMNPEDAARAFLDLGADRLVAMHWGTFRLTDEPLGAPPLELERVWSDARLEAERRRVLAVGETLWL